MALNINILGVNYPVPTNASDTNWAATQVAFEQAAAAGINSVSTDLLELDESLTTVAWTPIPDGQLLNSWTNNAWVASRTKDAAGWVTVRLNVQGGAAFSSCYQLPSGWRPLQSTSVPGVSAGYGCTATVGTDGNITITPMNGADVGADGIEVHLRFSTTA